MVDDNISPLARAIAEDEQSLFFFRLGCVDTDGTGNTFKDEEKEIRYQKWKQEYGERCYARHY